MKRKAPRKINSAELRCIPIEEFHWNLSLSKKGIRGKQDATFDSTDGLFRSSSNVLDFQRKISYRGLAVRGTGKNHGFCDACMPLSES